MHEITGRREIVLRLLKETIHHLGEDRPKTRKAGVRALGLAAESKWPVQRDEIVESLQRAYERAQERKAFHRALAAVPAATPEEAWYAPRDRTIALFQSAMDEYLEEKAAKAKRAAKKGKPKAGKPAMAAREPVAAAEDIEAFFRQHYDEAGAKAATAAMAVFLGEQFSELDPGWVEVVIEKIKLRFKGKAKFIAHKSPTDFRFPLAEKARIALVGDWGGGNDAAKAVAEQIKARQPNHVIHLGDVYYAGTEKEVKDRFLTYWKFWTTPAVRGRSFALNSNHEMYSGGYAYFNVTLPEFQQPASYFSLGNQNVRFIGLDTGYVDHDLNKEQVDWLEAQLKEGPAKTILLSHHQLFSAFEEAGERLEARLKPFLDAKKIYAWFWGHEHLCIVYDLYKGIRGRCVGNGCFPYALPPEPPPRADVPVRWVDRRREPDQQGMHSFALLTIDGPTIHVQYIDEDGTISFEEEL